MLRKIKNILRFLSSTAALVSIIATPYFGYLWFVADASNPEAKYYFFTTLSAFVAALLLMIYGLAPSDSKLDERDREKTEWRVKYAYIADKIEKEIGNLEELQSDKEFEGLKLKAVAHYSFECLKEEAEKLPKKLRFRFLVAAIANEADRQLENKTWASRDASRILPLARKLVARVRPLAATERELREHS